MKARLLYIFFLSVLLFPTILSAQSSKVVSDFRSRATLKLEKKLVKNLKGFAEFELGLEQDLSKVGKIHGEAGIEFAPAKFLDLEAKYRFTKNRKNYSVNYKYTHTYAFSAQYNHRFDLLKFYFRLQCQNKDDEAMSSTSIEDLRNIVKPRLKFKYDIWGTRFSPYVFSELYLSTHKFHFEPTKLKSCIGIEYSFYNKSELGVYYRNDRELNNYLPYTYHTIGFSYCIKL